MDEKLHPRFMAVTPVDGWDQDEIGQRVLTMVDKQAIVETDGMGGLNALGHLGYQHLRTISAHLGEDEHFSPVLHTQISNLKTVLQGTFHRSPSREHLGSYLDAICFRFNRRNVRTGVMDRLINAVALSSPALLTSTYPCQSHPIRTSNVSAYSLSGAPIPSHA
ncbi:MAG: transposase [Ferrimicrobium sp.]|nr:transposase [Ferrimicrobium sp.]